MKQAKIILFIILFPVFIYSQTGCNLATSIPQVVYYPNSVSNYTNCLAGYDTLYLCGTNTIVYDTTCTGNCRSALLNPGSTLYLKRTSCPGSFGAYYVKDNATLILKAGSTVIRVKKEPLAIIINQSLAPIITTTCTSLTFPTINCLAGIEENNLNENIFSLSPNPSSGFLKIESKINLTNNPDIIIRNQLGQTVFEYLNFDLTKKEISIENLANGIYYVCFKTKEFITTKKISVLK